MDDAIAVVCPTCAGRIRVKDLALIGQIITCPKCHGLVLISVNQEQVRLDVPEPVDSEVETRDAFSLSSTIPPPPPQHQNAPAPTPIAAAWEQPQTRHKRQILMVATVGGFGLLAAALLFAGFVWSAKGKANAKKILPPPEAQIPLADEVIPSAVGPDEEFAAKEALPETDRGVNVDAMPKADDIKPAPELAASTEPLDNAAEGREAAMPASPLDANQQPRELVDPTQKQPNAMPKQDLNDLPEELRPFVNFLNIDLPSVADSVRIPAPPTAAELRLQLNLPAPQDDTLHPPPEETVDVKLRLEKRIIGFQASKVSLADLARSIGQLAGVPIWFDQAKLDAAGIDIAKPIDVRVVGKTIGETLTAATTAAGCIYSEDPPGFVCVHPSDDAIQQRIVRALAINDLIDSADSPDITLIEEMLSRFLPPAPVSEQPEQAPTTNAPIAKFDATSKQIIFSDTASIGHKWFTAMSLEALRAARSLQLQLPRTATERWLFQNTPPVPQPLADEPTNLQGDYSLPLSEWFYRLAKQKTRR